MKNKTLQINKKVVNYQQCSLQIPKHVEENMLGTSEPTFYCRSRRRELGLGKCLDDFLNANAFEKRRSACFRCPLGRKNRCTFSETSGDEENEQLLKQNLLKIRVAQQGEEQTFESRKELEEIIGRKSGPASVLPTLDFGQIEGVITYQAIRRRPKSTLWKIQWLADPFRVWPDVAKEMTPKSTKPVPKVTLAQTFSPTGSSYDLDRRLQIVLLLYTHQYSEENPCPGTTLLQLMQQTWTNLPKGKSSGPIMKAVSGMVKNGNEITRSGTRLAYNYWPTPEGLKALFA